MFVPASAPIKNGRARPHHMEYKGQVPLASNLSTCCRVGFGYESARYLARALTMAWTPRLVHCDLEPNLPALIGRTAIVTGGANGIGEAYVRALHAAQAVYGVSAPQ